MSPRPQLKVTWGPGTTPAVPYIAMWSSEKTKKSTLTTRNNRLAYIDESPADRYHHGPHTVLWERVTTTPNNGTPQFARIHPLRQRTAMHHLLCQVCAGPATTTDDAHLWLISDPLPTHCTTPNPLISEPPICTPCARRSMTLCPRLRHTKTLLQVHDAPIAGIQGSRLQPPPKPSHSCRRRHPRLQCPYNPLDDRQQTRAQS